ncbi:MAG: hypothetical protein Q9159_003370 [Coniocarpon cinnabarinum]
MNDVTLHLRSETKPLEHRSALTPTTTRALLDAGYQVHVERSPVRIFEDVEFERVGAKLVPTGSWPEAPKDHIIIGLKELPEEETFPLTHTHVQFAHCYKGQDGWDKVLGRFPRGNGTLLDLEFLQDDSGRRVAAFGYHAGFAGAALAVEAWSWQLARPREAMQNVKPYSNEAELLQHISTCLRDGERIRPNPKVLVMGALGRCGRGAVELLEKIGLPSDNIVKWDIQETSAKAGPYQEIVECDIFVNCIYLSAKIPPFVDFESLQSPNRRLSVVCDVSCDTTNPHINTTFDRPTVPVAVAQDPPLSVISIDHLPTLLPREASEAFSHALLPSLLHLNNRHEAAVWQGAEKLFREKVATLPREANGHA